MRRPSVGDASDTEHLARVLAQRDEELFLPPSLAGHHVEGSMIAFECRRTYIVPGEGRTEASYSYRSTRVRMPNIGSSPEATTNEFRRRFCSPSETTRRSANVNQRDLLRNFCLETAHNGASDPSVRASCEQVDITTSRRSSGVFPRARACDAHHLRAVRDFQLIIPAGSSPERSCRRLQNTGSSCAHVKQSLRNFPQVGCSSVASVSESFSDRISYCQAESRLFRRQQPHRSVSSALLTRAHRAGEESPDFIVAGAMWELNRLQCRCTSGQGRQFPIRFSDEPAGSSTGRLGASSDACARFSADLATYLRASHSTGTSNTRVEEMPTSGRGAARADE